MNVIDRARDLIVKRGWAQNAFEAPDGSVCIVGALNRVDVCPSWDEAYDALTAEVREIGYSAIERFNDHSTTSLEDVLLVMKRASARLDEASSC